MAFDGSLFVVIEEVDPIIEDHSALEDTPITAILPRFGFTRVTKSSPPTEFVKELKAHLVENLFGDDGFVVIGPTPNDGIDSAK